MMFFPEYFQQVVPTGYCNGLFQISSNRDQVFVVHKAV